MSLMQKNNLPYFLYSLLLFLLSTQLNYAQSNLDTLTFDNGNVIIGEIKSFSRGLFTIETDYSDSDFQAKWKQVDKINSSTYFLVTSKEGRHYFGKLKDYTEDSVLVYGSFIEKVISYDDLVFMHEQGRSFTKKVYGSFDLGYSYTKANNLQQLSSSTSLKYINQYYESDLKVNNLFSKQDSAADIQRNEASLNFIYLFDKNYYALVNNDFLTNTEQSIDLRYTLQTGVGKFFIHTNKLNLGVSLGINYLNEKFMNINDRQESMETFWEVDLDIFDLGNLELDVSLITYKSLNFSKRWREDVDASLKYNLPFNFYIKLGYSMDYDNQPAEPGKNLDFIFTTSFGWDNL